MDAWLNWLEQATLNRQVLGSSPSVSTKVDKQNVTLSSLRVSFLANQNYCLSMLMGRYA